MKTELADRTLWFDGTCEVNADRVPELLLHGVNPSDIVVKEMTKDIKDFNLLSDDEFIACGKTHNEKIDMSWNIPESYQKLNLIEYVMDRAKAKGPAYVKRAEEELAEIGTRGLGTIFKTLIFVIDQLKLNKQLWGVGRGSSCASLVLHLIGVHEVDPVKYDIPMEEFYHD